MPPELVPWRRSERRRTLRALDRRGALSLRHAVAEGEDAEVLLHGERDVEMSRSGTTRNCAGTCFDSLEPPPIGDRLRGDRRIVVDSPALLGPSRPTHAVGHLEVEPVDEGVRPVPLDDALRAHNPGDRRSTGAGRAGIRRCPCRSSATERTKRSCRSDRHTYAATDPPSARKRPRRDVTSPLAVLPKPSSTRTTVLENSFSPFSSPRNRPMTGVDTCPGRCTRPGRFPDTEGLLRHDEA